MKRIFSLDFDGPMIPAKAYSLPGNQKVINRPKNFYSKKFDENFVTWFDPEAVEFVNDLLHEFPDMELVVHSSWGKICQPDFIIETLEKNGVRHRLHENWLTPKKASSDRWDEVYWWMCANEWDQFLAIDDERAHPHRYMGQVWAQSIPVTFEMGIEQSHREKIFEYFRSGRREFRGGSRADN